MNTGALLGGFLATAFGFGDPIDEVFDLSTWVAAIAGALIILFLWNTIRERRLACHSFRRRPALVD